MDFKADASLNDNIDQQIVLDSDRNMRPINLQPDLQSKQLPLSPAKSRSQIAKHHTQTQTTLAPSANTFTISKALHPVACMATLLFKILAIFSLIASNVIIFIFVLVMSALDFWVVKNVTGRLLVGLRWWSQYNAKGQQIWKFQTYDQKYIPNPIDQTFFWTAQIIATVVWAILSFINILTLTLFWGTLTIINLSLCGINMYGYYRCKDEYKNKIKGIKILGIQHIISRIFK